MLHYVQRTLETVILDDAAAQSMFGADPYMRECPVRSVLCLPLIKQGKLVGVLYLENNLASGVFAPAQIAILKLLASQAAIALENTHLYRQLAEREAKIRRLVDSNIVGIFTWRLDGRISRPTMLFFPPLVTNGRTWPQVVCPGGRCLRRSGSLEMSDSGYPS